MRKQLTANENIFAISRAYGKTQVEAYKDAGYSLLSPQIMAVEASKIEHRPHVKEQINALRNEIKDNQKDIYIWNRERATEKIIAIMDRIEKNDQLFSRHTQTLLGCIAELNKIYKVQNQTQSDKKIQIIIGGRDKNMPDDTLDFTDD